MSVETYEMHGLAGGLFGAILSGTREYANAGSLIPVKLPEPFQYRGTTYCIVCVRPPSHADLVAIGAFDVIKSRVCENEIRGGVDGHRMRVAIERLTGLAQGAIDAMPIPTMLTILQAVRAQLRAAEQKFERAS